MFSGKMGVGFGVNWQTAKQGVARIELRRKRIVMCRIGRGFAQAECDR